MTVESGGDPTSRTLAWRVLTAQEQLAARLGRFRWFLSVVVFSLVVVFVWPSQTRLYALAAGLPLFVGMWWWLVVRPEKLANTEPNVWLNENEFSWTDAQGQKQMIKRDQAEAFIIWDADETSGAIRLQLKGRFLSQPISSNRQVTLPVLEDFVANIWGLPKNPDSPVEAEAQRSMLGRVAIYSEMHDMDRLWHVEGTTASLDELCRYLEKAANAPLPPVGACPWQQHVVPAAHEDAPLFLLVDHVSLIGASVVSAPPEKMRELAAQIRRELANRGGERDWSFEWPTDDGVWTVTLHVIAESPMQPG